MSDETKAPDYYMAGDYHCLDIMRARFGESAYKAFCTMNAFKYLFRAGRKAGVDGGEDAAQRESALLRDLYWLLHQGHVIDFATKNLQVARRPAPKKPAPGKPESQKVEESGAAAAPAAEVEDSGRGAQAAEEVQPPSDVEVVAAPAAEAQAPSES